MPNPFFNDTLSAADNARLDQHTSDSGATWARPAGIDNAFLTESLVITANRARNNGNPGWLNVSAVPPSNEYDIDMVIRCQTAGSGQIFGIVFCYVNASNLYQLQCDPSSNKFQIYRTVNGSAAAIGDGNTALASGTDYNLKIRLTETGIVVMLNGVTEITSSDATHARTGKFGLYAYGPCSPTTGIHLDSISATAPTPKVNGTAYVSPSLGNDMTGVANDEDFPFATIDAALNSLLPGTSDAKNVVQLYAERYAPVRGAAYSTNSGTTQDVPGSLLKNNIVIRGVGKPTVAANGRTLQSGTIIDGSLFAWNDGIEFHDLGVDCGIDVCTARFAGTAQEGFGPCWTPGSPQDPITYPQRANVTAKNITSLGMVGATIHAFLSENCTNFYAQNITSVFGFAGVVAKTQNSTYHQLTCLGQGTALSYGVVIKTNEYSPCHDVTMTDVKIAPFVGTGSGAQSQGAGALSFVEAGDGADVPGIGNPDLYNITVNGLAIERTGQAAVNFSNEGIGTIHDVTVSNVLRIGSTQLGSLAGNANCSITEIAAPVTAVGVSVNAETLTAISAVTPNNAPSFVRYSVNQGVIDSYTGELDLSDVEDESSTVVTALSNFGVAGVVVQGTAAVDFVSPNPPALSVTNGDGSATLSATAAAGDTTAIRFYRPGGLIEQKACAGGATVTRVVTGLSNGQQYGFWATAVDAAGNESVVSNEVFAKPKAATTFPTVTVTGDYGYTGEAIEGSLKRFYLKSLGGLMFVSGEEQTKDPNRYKEVETMEDGTWAVELVIPSANACWEYRSDRDIVQLALTPDMAGTTVSLEDVIATNSRYVGAGA